MPLTPTQGGAGAPGWSAPSGFAALLRARARNPYVTWTMVAANCLLFVATAVLAGNAMSFDSDTLLRLGALAAPKVLAGEWWRLPTAMFLHGGLVHLAFNMLALYQVGLIVERLYGSRTYAAIYLLAGLAGGCASLFWRQDVISVGASGAVFGVYGALLAYLLVQRGSIPGAVLRHLRASTVLFVGYSLVIGFGDGKIDNAAHLGGLAGGFVLGAAVARPLDRGWSLGPLLRGAAACAGLVLIGATLLWLTPDPQAGSLRARALNQALKELARTDDEADRRLDDLRGRIERRAIDGKSALAVLERDIVPLWDEQLRGLRRLGRQRPELDELRRTLIAYAERRRVALRDTLQAVLDKDKAKASALRREQLLGQQKILDLVRESQAAPGSSGSR